MNADMRAVVFVLLCLSLAIIPPGCSREAASGLPATPQAAAEDAGDTADNGLVEEVSKTNHSGKYAFVLFYSEENEETNRLRTTVESTKGELMEKASFLEADISSQAARPYVRRYNLDRMPMPLLLAFAQNGTAVRSLQAGCTPENIMKSFVSPKTAEIFKAVQEGKTIILLFGNEEISGFKETLPAAKKVALVQNNVCVVVIDPADQSERSLLEQNRVSSEVDEAVLMVISGGRLGARLQGNVTTGEIADAINACSSQCG